jgi:hypothetical protein
MKQVEIFVEAVVVGAGKNGRAGCCALLGFNGHFKALGQYLGEGVKETDALSIAVELALAALRETCNVTIYTAATIRSESSLPLFASVNIHKQVIPPDSHPRQIAAATAAYEIALGGIADDFILKRAVEYVPEVRKGLVITTPKRKVKNERTTKKSKRAGTN